MLQTPLLRYIKNDLDRYDALLKTFSAYINAHNSVDFALSQTKSELLLRARLKKNTPDVGIQKNHREVVQGIQQAIISYIATDLERHLPRKNEIAEGTGYAYHAHKKKVDGARQTIATEGELAWDTFRDLINPYLHFFVPKGPENDLLSLNLKEDPWLTAKAIPTRTAAAQKKKRPIRSVIALPSAPERLSTEPDLCEKTGRLADKINTAKQHLCLTIEKINAIKQTYPDDTYLIGKWPDTKAYLEIIGQKMAMTQAYSRSCDYALFTKNGGLFTKSHFNQLEPKEKTILKTIFKHLQQQEPWAKAFNDAFFQQLKIRSSCLTAHIHPEDREKSFVELDALRSVQEGALLSLLTELGDEMDGSYQSIMTRHEELTNPTLQKECRALQKQEEELNLGIKSTIDSAAELIRPLLAISIKEEALVNNAEEFKTRIGACQGLVDAIKRAGCIQPASTSCCSEISMRKKTISELTDATTTCKALLDNLLTQTMTLNQQISFARREYAAELQGAKSTLSRRKNYYSKYIGVHHTTDLIVNTARESDSLAIVTRCIKELDEAALTWAKECLARSILNGECIATTNLPETNQLLRPDVCMMDDPNRWQSNNHDSAGPPSPSPTDSIYSRAETPLGNRLGEQAVAQPATSVKLARCLINAKRCEADLQSTGIITFEPIITITNELDALCQSINKKLQSNLLITVTDYITFLNQEYETLSARSNTPTEILNEFKTALSTDKTNYLNDLSDDDEATFLTALRETFTKYLGNESLKALSDKHNPSIWHRLVLVLAYIEELLRITRQLICLYNPFEENKIISSPRFFAPLRKSAFEDKARPILEYHPTTPSLSGSPSV